MTPSQPTLLGHIGAVTGATVSVRQSPGIASGIAIIGGNSYRIGQVGSFVRIPQGYHDLYGIVSEVGASATPQALPESTEHGDRWMTIQLVGEVVGASFERGISQYPNVNDEVHLVTEEHLAHIYGREEKGQVAIGRLANAEGIPVRIDLDKLVTRHSAVLGSTGSGKSTTVASLLRAIARGSENETSSGFPSARILLIDIHGEYGRALSDVSAVFRVNPNNGEHPLYIPYWAIDPSEILSFVMGRLEDKSLTPILERVFDHRMQSMRKAQIDGIDLSSITVDTPIPYSLKQLWFDLIDPEIRTWEDSQKTRPALEEPGDADALRAPKYKPAGMGNTPPFLNLIGVLSIRRQLEHMRSRLNDRQYGFLLRPGPWEPSLDGAVEKDIPELLSTWFGHDKPITTLDLSGVPSHITARLLGAILKIVCDSMFWARDKAEGAINRPILIVMEEAHRYLGKETDGPARDMVQRVVKEGRKFGLGAMIISQRPSEIDETILSQCGTFLALRLSNGTDRTRVQAALPDSLAGIVDTLPVLRTGEAIIMGEAARLPIRCRISLPAEEHRPNSEDPPVSANWHKARTREDYGRVAASWRSQNSLWAKLRPSRVAVDSGEEDMERIPVASTNVVSVGYDANSETLEIEFANGGCYQYYNVPEAVFTALMQSDSKGQFLHNNIRNAFPYSRV